MIIFYRVDNFNEYNFSTKMVNLKAFRHHKFVIFGLDTFFQCFIGIFTLLISIADDFVMTVPSRSHSVFR